MTREDLWIEVRYYARMVPDFIKNLGRYIRRVVEYTPVLWEDRDFDYFYTLKMLRYKLERTRKHIVGHQIIADADKIGEQIQHAENLIKRLMNDQYSIIEEDAHELKWGKMEHDFIDWAGDEQFREWKAHRTNATTPELQKQEREEQMVIYDKAIAERQADWNKLWDHLKNTMMGYWD